MDRNTEFFKNTLILLIGKFATQFINILLIPLYTNKLLTNDYGIVDLLQTYISLFVPILTLKLDGAMFRFLIDNRNNKDEKNKIITNILILVTFNIFITILLAFLISKFITIKYFSYVLLNLVLMMISDILLQLLRGLGKNKEYSICSIITALVTLIFNLILILIFKFGANSILISSSISSFICILFIIFKIKLYNYIKVKYLDLRFMKNMIKYSWPLIPNSLSWWIVNVSDRTIISFFLGTAFNGIYTVSCKFSNILNSIYTIFGMSWHETASLHINDKDKDIFFSDIINRIYLLFSSVSILIIAVLPFLYNIFIGQDYLSSYNYIPILLYSNTLNVIINLIGGIYIAKKRTKEVASTTIMSSILNILINIIMIKWLKLYAACISTLVSYVIMSIYRYIDCQKYVKIKLNIKQIIIYTILFILESIVYLKNNFILNIIALIFTIVYVLLVNKKVIDSVILIIKNKIFNMRKGEL